MIRGPIVLSDQNLSLAWGRALLALCRRGTTLIAPLTVTITNLVGGPQENAGIRNCLDQVLQANRLKSVRTTASTIFPNSMWRRDAPRARLYERYLVAYPRIRRAHRANQYGTYFHRMIEYLPDGCPVPVNQLEHIIETYLGNNHRRSALQAVVFDPTRDHTNQRQRGFPCLHQVAFSPINDGELAVTGFYGTQHIVQRAYGNYVGLCRLGEFIAQELRLELARVTCVAAVAELGVPKAAVNDLARAVRDALGIAPGAEDDLEVQPND